jgi:hypothetical protein
MRLSRTPRREIVRVVTKAFFVLVGTIVFFVDHDQAEAFKGGKECAASTDRNGGLARSQTFPLREAIAGFEAAMQNGDFVPKARANPRNDLVGQGNFGHEHEGLAAGFKGFGDGTEIDFCFSTARDTVEQEGLCHLALDRVAQGNQSIALVIGQ